MKRFFQRTALLLTLFFGQPALAQDIVQRYETPVPATPNTEVRQELPEKPKPRITAPAIQKSQPYSQRLSIEEIVRQTSYQECRNQNLDYSSQNQQKYSEMRELMMETPVLNQLYRASIDRRPFELYDGRIIFTISSRPNFSQGNMPQGNQFYVTRKKDSALYGILRKLREVRKIWKK
ncbi:MAG: hypothetical protein AABX79_02605 [Nanoarchaeota archaeon]